MANPQGGSTAAATATVDLHHIALPYPLAVRLAADVFAARQLRAAHPQGTFQADKRFTLDLDEASFLPPDAPLASQRFPFAVLNYARSKRHIAAMFNVSVEDLTAEVERRKAQRARSAQARENAGFYATDDGGCRSVNVGDGGHLKEYPYQVNLLVRCRLAGQHPHASAEGSQLQLKADMSDPSER